MPSSAPTLRDSPSASGGTAPSRVYACAAAGRAGGAGGDGGVEPRGAGSTAATGAAVLAAVTFLLRGFFTEAGSTGGFLTGSARRVVRLALELDVRADALDRAASFFLVVRGRLVVDIQCPSSLS